MGGAPRDDGEGDSLGPSSGWVSSSFSWLSLETAATAARLVVRRAGFLLPLLSLFLLLSLLSLSSASKGSGGEEEGVASGSALVSLASSFADKLGRHSPSDSIISKPRICFGLSDGSTTGADVVVVVVVVVDDGGGCDATSRSQEAKIVKWPRKSCIRLGSSSPCAAHSCITSSNPVIKPRTATRSNSSSFSHGLGHLVVAI